MKREKNFIGYAALAVSLIVLVAVLGNMYVTGNTIKVNNNLLGQYNVYTKAEVDARINSINLSLDGAKLNLSNIIFMDPRDCSTVANYSIYGPLNFYDQNNYYLSCPKDSIVTGFPTVACNSGTDNIKGSTDRIELIPRGNINGISNQLSSNYLPGGLSISCINSTKASDNFYHLYSPREVVSTCCRLKKG